MGGSNAFRQQRSTQLFGRKVPEIQGIAPAIWTWQPEAMN